jgi:hypothetical protein
MPKEYRWSKTWAVQAEHDECQVGQVITVFSQDGPKKVRVTDVVVRKTKSDKAYDLLFTVDVD